jgi:hypothetical protein
MNIEAMTVDFFAVLGVIATVASGVAAIVWCFASLAGRVKAIEGELAMLKEAIDEFRKSNENITAMVVELKYLREGQSDIKDIVKAVECRLNRIVDCSYTTEDAKS